MKNVRWNSPFPYSICHKLFIEHLTELNKMYWAHVPAANTIEKEAMSSYKGGNKELTKFFLIQDENDRRLAPSFDEWKEDYRNFLNFNRLNMILSICSCFEVYLRSIVSLAIESKPGVILGDSEAIDGVKLLKYKKEYSIYNENTYPFYKHVDKVCRGEWKSRVNEYRNLFGFVPPSLEDNIGELDKLRKLRNDIAHYFGREKRKYENPLIFQAEPIIRVSHELLMHYWKLVSDVVNAIESHLYKDFIGSYEVLKYYQVYKKEAVTGQSVKEKARVLKALMGENNMQIVHKSYYIDILNYYNAL